MRKKLRAQVTKMAINLRGGSGLRGNKGSLRDSGSNVEPMANVANIVDAILVMSVGLMLAIVTLANVDITNFQEVVQQDEVTEVDVNEMAENMTQSGSSFNELGTVYQDPSTGTLYMLTQDVDKGASSKGSSSSGKSK